LSARKQAVDGNVISGVDVATITASISFGVRPAFSIASLAAGRAISLAFSHSSAILLSFIPVLVVIHSSDVSKNFSRSKFVRILSGMFIPIPFISALISPIYPNLSVLQVEGCLYFLLICR